MRKQRAFATLTEHEIDQIAEWLRHDTYDHVRDRIAKPRPEGFALQLKSRRPLETLWQKRNTVDKINAKLQTGQTLTLAQFESIWGSAGVPPAVEGVSPETSSSSFPSRPSVPDPKLIAVHKAIIETTYDLVTSADNTPYQLLALQKLADFPARAAYRDHKIQMDLHRKHIANERLAISHRLANIREEELTLKKFKPLGSSGTDRSEFRSQEELDAQQAEVEAKIRADPLLSKIGLPPVDWPPEQNDPCEEPDLTCQTKHAHLDSRTEQAVTESLEERVNRYTLGRYREALIGKDRTKVGRAGAFNFRSAMQHCPCAKHLPCPEHGDFPPYFFEIFPDDVDYFRLLQKKKLPFTSVHELLRREAELSCHERETPDLTAK